MANILSICSEKQHHFLARDYGFLAPKSWVISEKCDVSTSELTGNFFVSFYDSSIKHLPAIARDA